MFCEHMFVVVIAVVISGAISQEPGDYGNPGVSPDVLQQRLVTVLAQPPAMPPSEVDTPLAVNVSFSLIDVVNARKRNNEVDVILWLNMAWRDVRLQWHPEEFSNLKQLYLTSSSVWVPDIVPYSVTRPVEHLFPSKVTVTHSGVVHYIPALRLTVPCAVRRAGRSTCTMKWGSWTVNGDVMDVRADQAEMQMDAYYETSMFDVKSTAVTRKETHYSCCPEAYPELLVTFAFKPKSDKPKRGKASQHDERKMKWSA